MAEDVDPIKTLISAREKLVEERRGLAVTIALGYRRRRTDDLHTNETREAFIDVQNLIEAVDRAIAHENLLTVGESDTRTGLPIAIEPRPNMAEALKAVHEDQNPSLQPSME